MHAWLSLWSELYDTEKNKFYIWSLEKVTGLNLEKLVLYSVWLQIWVICYPDGHLQK